jgi:hypothetical protein
MVCQAADLAEIVRRGTAVLQADWAADPGYAYVETDHVQKNGQETSHSYQVVFIAGSDYNVSLPASETEVEKLKSEIQRRNSESPQARRQRMANYKKQRAENSDLLMEFPKCFTFELLGEETMNGHAAYVLAASPVKRTGQVSRAAKVLSGMQGKVWLDRETFHMIRAECVVIAPVPVYGVLARVMPGTQIELQMSPVTESVWLINDFSMTLNLSKLWFKSKQVTESTYTKYRLNQAAIDELLR